MRRYDVELFSFLVIDSLALMRMRTQTEISDRPRLNVARGHGDRVECGASSLPDVRGDLHGLCLRRRNARRMRSASVVPADRQPRNRELHERRDHRQRRIDVARTDLHDHGNDRRMHGDTPRRPSPATPPNPHRRSAPMAKSSAERSATATAGRISRPSPLGRQVRGAENRPENAKPKNAKKKKNAKKRPGVRRVRAWCATTNSRPSRTRVSRR